MGIFFFFFLSSEQKQTVNKVNPVLQSLTVYLTIGSTDSAYSDVIYSIYIYLYTYIYIWPHTRTHTRTHAHSLYITIDYVMPPMHRFITCTKFVIMKKKYFIFFFLTRAYVFLTGSQKVSRKDNACSSLLSFSLSPPIFFSFFYRHLLRWCLYIIYTGHYVVC